MIDKHFNPHRPGSDEWHRYNLGIEPDALGVMVSAEENEFGLWWTYYFFNTQPTDYFGWFFGPEIWGDNNG